jgi:hypothetical protein
MVLSVRPDALRPHLEPRSGSALFLQTDDITIHFHLRSQEPDKGWSQAAIDGTSEDPHKQEGSDQEWIAGWWYLPREDECKGKKAEWRPDRNVERARDQNPAQEQD